MSDVISDLEFLLLNTLIGVYFPFCDGSDENRRRMTKDEYTNNIYGGGENFMRRNLSQLIGLSSKPNDIANGETCDVQNGMEIYNDCFVIEGRLTLTLSDYNLLDTYQSQISASIESFMNDGLLDDCHPAVIEVRFLDIGLSEIDQGYNNATADDSVESGETIEIFGGRASWIAMSSGLSLLFGVIVITRYRYTASTAQYQEESNDAGAVDDSNNSSEFIDITSNYQMYNIREEDS